jgi:hypothetical protein
MESLKAYLYDSVYYYFRIYVIMCFRMFMHQLRFISRHHACRGSSGLKPQYGLITLAYQRFTTMSLLLIYGSLFLSGVCYCLRVFCCAVARMSELESQQCL